MMPTPTRRVFHPGRTLAEALDGFSMSQKELSTRTGLTTKHINEIIKAKTKVTPETALKLELALGISSSFWNNLQSLYDVGLAKAKHMAEKQTEVDLVRNKYRFYSQLAGLGYVQETRDAQARLEALLAFFGVTSLKDVRELVTVQYRKAATHSDEAIAAWLRIGQIEHRRNMPVADYDTQLLKDKLPAIRSLTSLRAEEYSSRLVDTLAECGVSLVFTPYIKRSNVNGATYWLNKRQPLMQISTRFKRNDSLWFTIFHEIAHILLHGSKSSFIEWCNPDIKAKEEEEADKYAAQTLIPPEEYELFTTKNKFSFEAEAIKDFAQKIDVGSDIVSGRLANDGLITWSMHQKEFVRKIELHSG